MFHRAFPLCLLAATLLVAPLASADEPPASVPPPAPPVAVPELDAHVNDGSLIIEVDEGDARVFLDGAPVGAEHFHVPMTVAAGAHVVEARKEGFAPDRKQVTVGAGQTVGVVLRVVPDSLQAIGYDAPANQPQMSGNGSSLRLPLILTGAGLALAALGVGVGMNLAANSNADDANAQQAALAHAGASKSTCLAPTAAFVQPCSALDSALVSHDNNANAAIAAYATSGVLAAATIAYAVWPLLNVEGHHRWMTAMQPAPMVGPSTGGLAVSGTF